MKEKHNKQLCELAKIPYVIEAELIGKGREMTTIAILIKAMWAINDNALNRTFIDYKGAAGYEVIKVNAMGRNIDKDKFYKCDYNDSNQQALEAALEYILDNEKKDIS